MKVFLNPDREIGRRSPMLYGQFIEHFHRQIYGGVYDPQSPFADEDGFRTDVLEAMRRIKMPILRWPGGCFVSSYHWKDAVGKERQPFFDKAWRVEDPNSFGTDEYIKLCRKTGCEPYICTNAGTGTAEEMSTGWSTAIWKMRGNMRNGVLKTAMSSLIGLNTGVSATRITVSGKSVRKQLPNGEGL